MTLIIFDIDGTLVYSNKIDSECFAATYERIYNRPFPGIDWHRYPHVTDTTIFKTVIRQHFNRDVEMGEIAGFREQFVSLLLQKRSTDPGEFREVAGAKDAILRLLEDRRFVVGVATGGWHSPAKIKLRHVGIPSEEMIFRGADGKTTRESIIEEVIEKARERHSAFRKIVYIGDALWDVVTTRAMQLDFVGIRRKNDLEVLKRAGATQVLENYLDFEGFLGAVAAAGPPVDMNDMVIW